MACYNAITELDPSDCLFKKQWEWEEVVRFHTPGWETWAGPETADWQPLKGSPTPRCAENPERPMRSGLGPAHQTTTANHGQPWEDPGIAVVHPTWDYGTITQKKRKSNSSKEKTHDGGARSIGGGDTILLLIGSLRLCDHRLNLISCRLSSSWTDCAFSKLDFDSAGAAKCCGRLGRYAALLALRDQRWSLSAQLLRVWTHPLHPHSAVNTSQHGHKSPWSPCAEFETVFLFSFLRWATVNLWELSGLVL